MQKRAIIVGATSGIGKCLAEELIRRGWVVGIAGRRGELLEEILQAHPQQVVTGIVDVTSNDAPSALHDLIARTGGMDLYLHVAGIGYWNLSLDADKELRTIRTNGEGFTRMMTTAFEWFAANNPQGQMAAVTSIAGTKGLGAAPAYSATKRFQNHYIDALEQMSRLRGLNIRFTDIRPGFVDTALIAGDGGGRGAMYPMLLTPEKVAHKAICDIIHKKRVCTIDWRYAVMVFFWRLIPRCLWKRMPIK